MKRLNLFFLFTIISNLSISAYSQIPELNQKIINYVETVIGKKVDRGECWDLAYQALTQNNAKWNGKLIYGIEVNPKTEEIFPGDIIQFENVKVRIIKGNTTIEEIMKHHTAIVYKVLGKGKYQLAHQNTQKAGRKVDLSQLDLSTIIKGNIKFYRPE